MSTDVRLQASEATRSAWYLKPRFAFSGSATCLGWLPAFSLVAASGLMLIALADLSVRVASPWAMTLFWTGLFLIYVPIFTRLVVASGSRLDTIGLVIILGVALYLVKVLYSPLGFRSHDEFAQWRTAIDIARTGHLFEPNPLLPVTALYPGLASLTVALSGLSKLDLLQAALLIIGAARLLHVVSLYMLFEELSRSPRIAGIAVAFYMTNPNFVFFDAHFAYESLALPLATLTLFAAVRRAYSPQSERFGWTFVALLGLGSTAVTHHLTSYMLIGFLLSWAVSIFVWNSAPTIAVAFRWYVGTMPGRHALRLILRQQLLRKSVGTNRKPIVNEPQGLALLGVVIAVTWLLYMATATLLYLGYIFGGGLTALIRFISGEESNRVLFRSFSGEIAPVWEQIVGYGAVILILLALPYSLLHIWRHYRANVVVLLLAVTTLAYPTSLLLRLTQNGVEISNRTSEFLFVALAFVLAIGVGSKRSTSCSSWKRSLVIITWAVIIFAGGVTVGRAPWARLPGPYLPGADMRSIEPEGIAAAEWSLRFLGPSNRIIADRTNRLLMGTFGEQRPVTRFNDGLNTALVVFSREIGETEKALLSKGQIAYVLVDRRLSTGLPMVGVFFEVGEPDGNKHVEPMDTVALNKFDTTPQVSRIFDSGDIVIYDVEALANG